MINTQPSHTPLTAPTDLDASMSTGGSARSTELLAQLNQFLEDPMICEILERIHCLEERRFTEAKIQYETDKAYDDKLSWFARLLRFNPLEDPERQRYASFEELREVFHDNYGELRSKIKMLNDATVVHYDYIPEGYPIPVGVGIERAYSPLLVEALSQRGMIKDQSGTASS